MLLFLVVVHELGHFATARSMGVKVLEFGVGFPPRAFGLHTGRTRVLLDPDTSFVNLESLADLRPGQIVKVSSTEDTHGNLVARIIEAPESRQGPLSRGAGTEVFQERLEPEGLLKHEGKVRAVEAGSFILADMLYSLNWTPLGGFVRMAGESNPDVPRSLSGKGVGTRFLVLVAGPLMNALLPLAVFTVLFMIPQDVTIGSVKVIEVPADSPAAAAGLQTGDVILRAGGHEIENRIDLRGAVGLNGGSDMEWVIIRDGEEKVIRVRPEFDRPPARWLTGIVIGEDEGKVVVRTVLPDSPAEAAGIQPADTILRAGGQKIERRSDLTRAIQVSRDSTMEWLIDREGREEIIQVIPQAGQPEAARWLTGESTNLVETREVSRSLPLWKAAPESFVATWELLVLVKQSIFGAVSEGSAPELSGPIGIAQLTGEVTREGGLTGWLFVTILLSINLAILNILPIPMLDGGRLMFVVLEWLRRGKRVPPEKEGLVHLVGFALLVAAILVISANDINRLIQGESLLGG
jgi:regulator of sigma E protease